VDQPALESLFEGRTEITFKRGGSLVEEAGRQVLRYLEGRLRGFSLQLDLAGSTSFSRRVWRAAARVPYGEVRSYAWIAERIRRPNSARAVGQALGRNPVPIVIPCHRVIGSQGSLGGFGAGLGLKRRLLAIESGQSTLGLQRMEEHDFGA
jgi:O-6-methylguanine DNA methyltransferase